LLGNPAPSRKEGKEATRGTTFGIDEECNVTPDGFGPLLRGGQGGTRQAVAIQAGCVRENPSSGPDGVGVRTDDTAYTLEARSEVQAVAFCQNTRDEVRLFGGDGQTVGALAAQSGMKQTCYVAVPEGKVLGTSTGSVPHCLNAGGMGRQDYETETMVIHDRSILERIVEWAVRRLLPVECERLQGFPDYYTLLPTTKRPDGVRYKACGNSMAVPVIRWIGKRIAGVYERN
jgi:DNA (cytosine-5)-methyltransferase 1